MTRSFTTVTSLLLALGLISCVADSEDSSPTGGAPPANIERSEACLELQQSYCSHYADDCSSISRETCDRIIGGTFCGDDEVVKSCTEAMVGGSCTEAPDICFDAFDTKPARWYCGELLDTICQRQAECQIQPKGDCIAMMGEVLDCSDAVSVSDRIADCVSRSAKMPCGAISDDGLQTLPLECDGIILLAESPDDLWP